MATPRRAAATAATQTNCRPRVLAFTVEAPRQPQGFVPEALEGRSAPTRRSRRGRRSRPRRSRSQT
jgi:hypothetical protein